jgi:hypothetical protein
LTAKLPRHDRLFSVLGVCLAFGVPAVALTESHVREDLSAMQSAILLTTTPWLILIWVMFVERRPLSSIGFHRPRWSTVGYGLAGIAVNLGISVGIGSLAMRLGFHEVDSGFPDRLIRQGYGWLLVVIVTGGAAMTEIAFRGYALERLTELAAGRRWMAGAVQIAVTTALFAISRPGHVPVWLVDDVVFTVYYFWRRDTTSCLVAHAVPNFVASTLAALGLAN